MKNVCEAWNAIRTDIYHANAPLSVKMAPKLRNFGAKNKKLSGYYGQDKAWAWIQFATKLFQSLKQPISKVYEIWEGNSTCHCHPMTPISVWQTLNFGRK